MSTRPSAEAIQRAGECLAEAWERMLNDPIDVAVAAARRAGGISDDEIRAKLLAFRARAHGTEERTG